MHENKLEFLLELKALFDKYDITLYGEDEYNGKDEYVGTEYCLHNDDFDIDISRINDLFLLTSAEKE